MDMPALAFGLFAVVAFREYVLRPTTWASVLFGTLASCAVLIKQQSIVLGILPIAYMCFSGRWDLFGRRDFWLAAVPPLVLAAPWYALTIPVFYENAAGWSGLNGQGLAAAGFRWSMWWKFVGVPIALLSLAGFIRGLMRASVSHAIWASLFVSALVGSALLRAMAEPRHVLLGLTAQLALAALAFQGVRTLYACLIALALAPLSWGFAPAPQLGYTAAAAVIRSGPRGHVLLSGFSDGPIIAAQASADPRGDSRRCWLRAGKVMAAARWSGVVTRMYFHSPGEIASYLREHGINQVFIDRNTAAQPAPEYSSLLMRALDQERESWTFLSIPIRGGPATLARRRVPLPPQPVSVFVPSMGRTLRE